MGLVIEVNSEILKASAQLLIRMQGIAHIDEVLPDSEQKWGRFWRVYCKLDLRRLLERKITQQCRTSHGIWL